MTATQKPTTSKSHCSEHKNMMDLSAKVDEIHTAVIGSSTKIGMLELMRNGESRMERIEKDASDLRDSIRSVQRWVDDNSPFIRSWREGAADVKRGALSNAWKLAIAIVAFFATAASFISIWADVSR